MSPTRFRFVMPLVVALASIAAAPAVAQTDSTPAGGSEGRIVEDTGNQPLRTRKKRVQAAFREEPRMEEQLQIHGSATFSLQAGLESDPTTQTAVGSLDLFVATRFSGSGLAFLDLESVGGSGPDASVPTFGGLNADATSVAGPDGLDRVGVLEAWLQYDVAFTTLTVGKIDLTNYFDTNALANDETSQFLSGALVNSTALPVAVNAPGIVAASLTDSGLEVQAGLSSRDDSGQEIFDDLIAMVGMGSSSEAGAWQAYAHAVGSEAFGGVGFSGHVNLAGRWALFGRAAINGSGLSRELGRHAFLSAGAHWATRAGDDAPVVGAAFAVTDPETEDVPSETVTEFYVRRAIDRRISVSPHLQIIRHPQGADDKRVFVGFRAQMDL